MSVTTTAHDRAAAGFPRAHPWIAAREEWPRTRHALWLIGRYFGSQEALVAWVLLTVLVAQQLGFVYVALTVNAFQKRLYDAVGARESAQLVTLLVTFVGVTMAMSLSQVIGDFVRGNLSIRWRRWLVEDYTGRWLDRRRFHDIERRTLIDNPDQRMTEDITLFVDGSLVLFSGVVGVPASVVSFSIVLWGLGTIDLNAIGVPVVIPGGLVLVSIVYTLLGSVALVVFGKPLVRRTMQQQHYEADFRYRLVSIRRNVEQVALSRLERGEWGRLVGLYDIVKRNFIGLVYVRAVVTFATSTFLNLKSVLPLLLSLPRYFAGQITMGDLMQTQNAFASLSGSLSWFIQVYPTTLAPTLASLNRLRTLDLTIEQPRRPGIDVAAGSDAAIRVEGVSLHLPTGAPLVEIGDWTILPGSRWIVRGRSGAGKSSLLRAIAGIWPDGNGRIALPADARMLFVPQQAYLGEGTLRSILTFPLDSDAFSELACTDALVSAHLGAFAARLDENADWGETMSPGEQQRIGFARILLHRPTHLFLDEATSALDPGTALAMYALVADRPGLTIVSVAHTDTLDRFHDHCLLFGDGGVNRHDLTQIIEPKDMS